MNFRLYFLRLRYKFQEIRIKFSNWLLELDKKGKERLTIMVIPHTEKKSINLNISYKSITIFISIILLLMLISAINVLNHSGSVHELTELNLSNKDFVRQSAKMKEEAASLHSVIQYYYDRIYTLYLKLGGDPSKVSRGIGGSANLSLSENTDIPPEVFRLREDLQNLKLSAELSNEILGIIKKRKSIIKHTPSLWPTKGYVLYPFGSFTNPVTGRVEENPGIDIAAFPGSEVVSTAAGIVYETGYTPKTGYFIKIAHKYGWKTIYSNLDRIKIQKNEKVSKGDVIAYVGKTSDDPTYHLHYEVHVGTKEINPFSFLNQIQE